MSSAVIGTAMARSAAARAAPGLALLVLIAGACTVNSDVDPSTGLDSGGETEDAVDEPFRTVLEADVTTSDDRSAADDSVGEIVPDALQPDSSGAGTGSSTGDAASASPAADPPGASPVIEVKPPPTTDPEGTTASTRRLPRGTDGGDRGHGSDRDGLRHDAGDHGAPHRGAVARRQGGAGTGGGPARQALRVRARRGRLAGGRGRGPRRRAQRPGRSLR